MFPTLKKNAGGVIVLVCGTVCRKREGEKVGCPVGCSDPNNSPPTTLVSREKQTHIKAVLALCVND